MQPQTWLDVQHAVCRLPQLPHDFAVQVAGPASGFGASQAPAALHTCPEVVQSSHCPPALPHVVDCLPPTQSPLALQHPVPHVCAVHGGFASGPRPLSFSLSTAASRLASSGAVESSCGAASTGGGSAPPSSPGRPVSRTRRVTELSAAPPLPPP